MYNYYRFNIIMRDVLRGDNSKQTNKQTKITDCMSALRVCAPFLVFEYLGLGTGLNSIKYLIYYMKLHSNHAITHICCRFFYRIVINIFGSEI